MLRADQQEKALTMNLLKFNWLCVFFIWYILKEHNKEIRAMKSIQICTTVNQIIHSGGDKIRELKMKNKITGPPIQFCFPWYQLWLTAVKNIKWKMSEINNSWVLNCVLFWVVWWNPVASCSTLPGTWITFLCSAYPWCICYLPISY
jgi:hypothetical protein